jgi:ribosome-associated protein
MIRITHDIRILEKELTEEFVRASGPGGQNVNKVATAVKLRFDVGSSESLPDDVRERLKKLAGRRLTDAGVLVIDARRYRTQKRNREDARDRLAALVKTATERPKKRRKTAPSRQSKERRLVTKKRRGETKRRRRSVGASSD